MARPNPLPRSTYAAGDWRARDRQPFGEASRALAQQVADDGYRPGVVLAIGRGGLLPAAAVVNALGSKNVFSMDIEFYTGIASATLDVAELLVTMVEEPEPDAPYGAKGIGEAPHVSSPAAGLAALRDATGLALARLPVRPEHLVVTR